MKIIECTQGDPVWLEARLGIPTASEFDKIITPATAKLSKQSRKYAFKLVAEKLLNRSFEDIETLDWVSFGKEMEPEAVRAYEFEREIVTATVGFCVTDDGRFGASPDRLVGERGLLEVKCVAPQTQVSYLVEGFDVGYQAQVQGQMWVTEREYVDFFSYNPELPRVLIRVTRDDAYIRLLADALNQFHDVLSEMMERVRAMGFFNSRPTVRTAVDDLAEAQDMPPGEIPIKGERYING